MSDNYYFMDVAVFGSVSSTKSPQLCRATTLLMVRMINGPSRTDGNRASYGNENTRITSTVVGEQY